MRVAHYGHSYLLRYWDELNDIQRRRLVEQIDSIDFSLLARLSAETTTERRVDALAHRAEPPPALRLVDFHRAATAPAARKAGEAALRAGKVGMILVAGGQGTRLGREEPKGMLPLGPVSQRSLFQILIERMLAVGRRHQARIPLYLMTSPSTHSATERFLNEHARFGLPEDDLHIFCQGVTPAICATTGQILMSDRDSVCLAPNGHGGMLEALKSSGGLDDACHRGLEQFFYCQVDNPLAPCCDPELLGHHLMQRSEMTTLAVAKTGPLERVGNIVSIDGRVYILEYSELPEDVGAQVNSNGSLKFWAGNTAIHVFDVAFLRRMADTPGALPYHRAKKVTAHLAADGQWITPTALNALKFERFIFDLLPLAQNAIVVEAAKREVFAPVKNASGEASDTPECAQAAMLSLYQRWLKAVGAQVADDVPVEIGPGFALDAEELASKLIPGWTTAKPTYLS